MLGLGLGILSIRVLGLGLGILSIRVLGLGILQIFSRFRIRLFRIKKNLIFGYGINFEVSILIFLINPYPKILIRFLYFK